MTLDYFYGQAGELFSFYRIPKALFQEPRFQSLSTDAKTLYGILLDRMSLSAKNGWLDEQGRVFIIFTIEDTAFLCRKDNDHFLILPSIYEKLDLDDWLLAHLFFYDKDGKRYIGVELSEVE